MNVNEATKVLIDKKEWVPICHGAKSVGSSWEISVIRSDNIHCMRSWGWEGETKFVISQVDENNSIPKDVYVEILKGCMKVAEDIASMMNERDRKDNLKPSFLFRFHRGNLDESMKTKVSFSSLDDLKKIIQDVYGEGKIGFHHEGMDDRIKWDTWLVTWRGNAVGFSNGNP